MTNLLTFPLFVLWLFSPQEWGGHQGLFTPGWVPHEVYYGASLCSTGKAEHEVTLKMAAKNVVCRPANDGLMHPVAVPIDRYAK